MIDPTTRGGAVPTGDRLVVSRSRLNRIRKLALEQHDNALDELHFDAAFYAAGVTDAISLLLDSDHPSELLAALLGLPDPDEDAEEARLEVQHQAELQRDLGRHRSIGMPRRI